MIELPELVILKIYSLLSYEDLKNLRVTCKKLKEIVDQRPSRSLHLFVKAYPFERELHDVSDPDILRSFKFKHQFKELLKLTICRPLLNH